MGKEAILGNSNENINATTRNYNLVGDAKAGIRRLINSFAEDNKAEPGMFEILELLLTDEPDIAMGVIRGSIEVAKERLGQDRSSGSSATLFYPIETATRIVALRNKVLPDALSSRSWNLPALTAMFRLYPRDIVELAGNNTTSLNLPHRAGHVLWMIDQVESIPKSHNFTFLEIGASAGLILDGLKRPPKFLDWMKVNGYTTNYGEKTISTENSVLGLDLVIPSEDWTKAVIPGDTLRDEVIDFMSKFSRSKVIQADATKLDSNIDVINHFKNTSGIAFVYSCAAFYQIPESVRQAIYQSTRTLLDQLGGGYFMVTDFASNMGFPNIHVGSASWVENHKNEIISPKIITSDQTLTSWAVVSDADRKGGQ